MNNEKIAFGCYQSNDAYSSVKTAIEAGYRIIDTARVYKNEDAVGRAVNEAVGLVERSAIYVTSKINARSHSLKETPKAIRQSLNRSNLAYIDLYLLHDAISGHERRLQAYKCLLDARANNQIRQVGVSNWNVKHLMELTEAGLELPAANQIELHPWCQQRDIVEYCRKNGIRIQAYCPLVRGERMLDPTLEAIAGQVRRTPAQVLLRWSIQHDFVPVVKSDNSGRIYENIQVFDFELDQDQMKELDGLDMGAEGACSWNPVNCA
ncbi:Aldo/keto reductase [Cystobasidium minutum MCA 4210]|uniref:Aldo/keto reductase n=1 Tax=Cystobasidium minutum MCA 4210 TaxID=1397322 RepID=UPI0034CE9345|eukprot:jgi/Rhomi1/139739/e_gw1.1.891.1